jgi:hypothetical protein
MSCKISLETPSKDSLASSVSKYEPHFYPDTMLQHKAKVFFVTKEYSRLAILYSHP